MEATAPAADEWRTNPRLTGDDTGFSFKGTWVSAQILSGKPMYEPVGGMYEVWTDGDEPDVREAKHQTLENDDGLTIWQDTLSDEQFGGERVNAHGTRERYVHGPGPNGEPGGCSCPACKAANAAYIRSYRARKRAKARV